ncbi:MAG: hypothetical protein AAB116_26950 [Candidatus Poribacteria bacterium]
MDHPFAMSLEIAIVGLAILAIVSTYKEKMNATGMFLLFGTIGFAMQFACNLYDKWFHRRGSDPYDFTAIDNIVFLLYNYAPLLGLICLGIGFIMITFHNHKARKHNHSTDVNINN